MFMLGRFWISNAGKLTVWSWCGILFRTLALRLRWSPPDTGDVGEEFRGCEKGLSAMNRLKLNILTLKQCYGAENRQMISCTNFLLNLFINNQDPTYPLADINDKHYWSALHHRSWDPCCTVALQDVLWHQVLKWITPRKLKKSANMVKCLREKFVDRTLKDFFYWLGCKIGESPGYFLVVPLLLTALCISGFQQMDYEFEPEYLGCTSFPIRSYFTLLYQLLSIIS